MPLQRCLPPWLPADPLWRQVRRRIAAAVSSQDYDQEGAINIPLAQKTQHFQENISSLQSQVNENKVNGKYGHSFGVKLKSET